MKKIIVVVVSAALLMIDLITKNLTEQYLRLGESYTVIEGFFDIHYARNTGGAWSMFDGDFMMPIFLLISLSVSIYLIYMLIKENDNLVLMSISLILAGNLGNFYDRFRFSYVRDMLSFDIFGYPFPIFNFADICLVIGFGLLFLHIFLEERKELKHD